MLDVFFLWSLITSDIRMDIPFLLVEFLAIQAGKDRCGSPLYGGMLISRLACSFEILERREASFLTIEPGKSFYVLL